jgi:type I restriction enzyme S subunit
MTELARGATPDFERDGFVDLIVETTEKSKGRDFHVWSVSNRLGFVRADEYFDKQIASVDTSNYKVVQPRTFAFNPSRINVGSIACNFKDETGIVSPMYTLFRVKDEERVSSEFLLTYLKSDFCRNQINQKIQGATRKVLKKDDLFSLQIPVPTRKEQRELLSKISSEIKQISVLDEQIDLHKSAINTLIAGIWE